MFQLTCPQSNIIIEDGIPVAVSAPWQTRNDNIYNANMGNVGIGTTSPSKKLDITGEMQATGSGNNYFAGNVGIGTTTPGRRLDVNGVTRSTTSSGSENANGQFQARAGGTANSQEAVYSFYPTFENTPGDIQPRRAADILSGFNAGNWGSEYLAFHVGNNGSSNDGEALTNERMRIIGNGNVGIGTTTPSAPLHVTANGTVQPSTNGLYVYNPLDNNENNKHAIICARVGGPEAGDPFISLDINTETGWSMGIDNSDQNSLKFSNSWDNLTSQTKMTLLTNGNVGIGTSTPSVKLEIKGSTPSNAILLLNPSEWNSTGDYGEIRFGDATHYIRGEYENGMKFYDINKFSFQGGNVGIGTTSPQCPLEVSGCSTISGLSYAWYANNGNAYYGCCGNSGCYSIKASNRILADEFNAISDRRIKDIIEISDTRQDLETINKLRVTLYHYKDMVGKGNNMKQGFIAQEVEEVVPDAVSRTSDFVPDIYAIPDHTVYNENLKELTITLDKEHGLAVNDLVRVYAADRMAEKTVSSVISPNEFILSDWEGPTDSLFVYGKKVDDFRVLDYDRIYTIGIGAIQELSGQLNEAQEKIKSLEARLDEIEMAVGGQQSAVGSRQSAVSSQRSAVSSQQSAVFSQQSAVSGQR
jgi:hypothetical protein